MVFSHKSAVLLRENINELLAFNKTSDIWLVIVSYSIWITNSNYFIRNSTYLHIHVYMIGVIQVHVTYRNTTQLTEWSVSDIWCIQCQWHMMYTVSMTYDIYSVSDMWCIQNVMWCHNIMDYCLFFTILLWSDDLSAFYSIM